MTLTRPLASIDIETTGTDPVLDRIVSLGVLVLHSDGRRVKFEQVFNPGIPISEGATAVHGITDAMVADKPPFKMFAARILAGLQGKDLLGYNIRSLDLPMLDEEFRRCGLVLDINGGPCPAGCHQGTAGNGTMCAKCDGSGVIPPPAIIDAFGIFCKKEPRDLATFVKRHAGRDHEGAHGALADSVGTLDGFLGCLQNYELMAMSLDELATFSRRDELDFVDLSGKLYRDKDGDVRFNFGPKTRGKKVKDDTGFAYWVLGKDFPGSTKDALRAELNRLVSAQ